MGGGGFSMEPENPLLDEFVLSLARSERPRVCFVPTASGDAESYVPGFYRAFSTFDCRPSDLTLFAGRACPHYDGDGERRPAFRRLIEAGELSGGWAADDGAALVFDGTGVEEVVASRHGARAYRVERSRQEPLTVRFLGD